MAKLVAEGLIDGYGRAVMSDRRSWPPEDSRSKTLPPPLSTFTSPPVYRDGGDAWCVISVIPVIEAGPHPTMAARPNEKMDLSALIFWQIDRMCLLVPMLNSHLTK
jgi:hypothetical protein